MFMVCTLKKDKEWVGIIEHVGYFDSISHLDQTWHGGSPFKLIDEYGLGIMKAYNNPEDKLSPNQALNTNPAELKYFRYS